MRLTDEQRKFAEENHNLIYGFMNRRGLDMEMYGAVAIGYVKAVATFDPKKAQFSTYAYMCMQNAVNLVYKKPAIPCISLNETFKSESGDTFELQDIIPDKFNFAFDIDPAADISVAINALPERARKILMMKAMGYKDREIAKHLGIARSYVNKIAQEVRRELLARI